jgi:hypothetical protein
MKTQSAKLLNALPLVLAAALSACGSNNPTTGGVPGVGIAGGGIITSPGVNSIQSDGSMVVSFSGQAQATSSYRLLAGQFPLTTGNCGSTGSYACFRDRIGGQTVEDLSVLGHAFGALSLGTTAAYGGSQQKPERFYYPIDGRTNITFSIGSNGGSSVPVSGVITLSPQFVANELAGRPVVGLGLDLSAASGVWGGQAFLLTSQSNGSFIVF